MSVEMFTVLVHMPREMGAEVQTSMWYLPPVLPVGSWVTELGPSPSLKVSSATVFPSDPGEPAPATAGQWTQRSRTMDTGTLPVLWLRVFRNTMEEVLRGYGSRGSIRANRLCVASSSRKNSRPTSIAWSGPPEPEAPTSEGTCVFILITTLCSSTISDHPSDASTGLGTREWSTVAGIRQEANSSPRALRSHRGLALIWNPNLGKVLKRLLCGETRLCPSPWLCQVPMPSP